MDTIEAIKTWLVDHPGIAHLAHYLVWVGLILALLVFLRRFLKRSLPDSGLRYNTQKGIEILGFLLVVIITISYFTGSIKDFGLALGLLTAGITITLQELILSIAGSFYIFFVRLYKPGDRIQLNGIKGDVIDVNSIYTTMMEIGEWVSGDNYSGRIVKISNSFVFKGPIYNYSQDFPFVWDEFELPIHYGSDIELAKALTVEVAQEVLSDFVRQSKADWKQVVSKYYIEDARLEPSLVIRMTDNWLAFNLRYIVDYKKRRSTRHQLQEKIGARIRQTDGKVRLASATYEVVAIPPVRLEKDS